MRTAKAVLTIPYPYTHTHIHAGRIQYGNTILTPCRTCRKKSFVYDTRIFVDTVKRMDGKLSTVYTNIVFVFSENSTEWEIVIINDHEWSYTNWQGKCGE